MDDLFTKTGRKLGHEAAERAANKAGEDWKAQAYRAFVAFARRGAPFTTEQVRADNPDIPSPPDMRAWGQIAAEAQRNGVVVSIGLTRARSRTVHGMIVTKWRLAK